MRFTHAPADAVVLALDPGLRCPGVAIHRGSLVACAALTMPDEVNELPVGERVDVVAERCVRWFYDRAWTGPGGGLDGGSRWFRDVPVRFVYEMPQVYGGPQAADANDLLHLAMVAGSAWTLLRQRGAVLHATPTPAQWTGGLEKLKTKATYWTSQRGQHLARRLSPAERALVGDSHDAADAASLCLWAVGRWAARRVIARRRPSAASVG